MVRGGSGGLSAVSPNSVGVIDPATNELFAEVPVGIDPSAVGVGEGAIWVANVKDETVSRIDAGTRERVRTIAVDGLPTDVTVGGGTVWVALGALAELTRIEPDQDDAVNPVAVLGGQACGAPRASLAFGRGAVWFVCENGELGRIDASTGKATSIGLEAGLSTSTSAVQPVFSDIAFGFGSFWFANRAENAIVRVDAETNQNLGTVNVGGAPQAIAAGADSLWVANFDDDTVRGWSVWGLGRLARSRTSRSATARWTSPSARKASGCLESRPDRDAARPGERCGGREDRDRERALADRRRQGWGLGQRSRCRDRERAGRWLIRGES